jgi:hypothetical protein
MMMYVIISYVQSVLIRYVFILSVNPYPANVENIVPNSIPVYSYIQQDATLHSLLYLETALHVSGGTSIHH